ncbi:MAG: signal peptidase I [Armatimonadota bacterium]
MTLVTIGTPKRRRSLLLTRVTPGVALLIIAAIAALRIWVVETAIVSGNSMSDTLANDDHVLISKLLTVSRFDVVVFEDPQIGGVDIKRIVGLPGDVISMVPHVADPGSAKDVYGSQLYINSIPYSEPYATSIAPRSLPPTKVPADSYFVLGDNRDDSVDSRNYGPIKAKSVRGVAVAVVYPFGRMRALDRDQRATPDMAAIEQR